MGFVTFSSLAVPDPGLPIDFGFTPPDPPTRAERYNQEEQARREVVRALNQLAYEN